MSYQSRETAKADSNAIDPYNAPREMSSPGLKGGSTPGSNNKLASETLKMQRTPMTSAAHKGDSVTRKDE